MTPWVGKSFLGSASDGSLPAWIGSEGLTEPCRFPCVWIGEVNVPRELVDGGRRGQLVLFVGAGASIDAPSSLPSFDRLTEDIAARASKPLHEGDLKHPDRFLGLLEDEGVRVREMVSGRLGRADSQPNRLHHAIMGLAATCPSARVVTTNFNRHLSAALATIPITMDEYMAPALPMGDDFEGLVYLHGSLTQGVRRLVLTDKDFGTAYLHDAWAARFLERMFRTRVVLFIGYSHSDVVMQYFARALGGNTSRYALTPNPEDRSWQTWGITPVGYRVDEGSHVALPIILEKWARLASMKRLEHVDRTQEIISTGIPAVPEEVSYLEDALADPEQARYFTEAARGTAWLQWAADRPEFARLSIGEADDELALTLARWVAIHFTIVDEKLSNAALEVMRVRLWNAQTWRVIVHAVCVFSLTEGVVEWIRPWFALLIERDPGASQDPGDFLTTLLASTGWREDPDTALMLLDHVTQPRLVTRPTLGFVQEPRFDVILRGTEMQLASAWKDRLPSLFPTHLSAMLAIVDHQLRGAYRLSVAANPTMTFDGISYKRVAIETIGPDTVHDTLDVLIDAARDLLLQALETHPALAQHYLDTWADAPETVLVRLAVHGWHCRNDRTFSEKLAWLAARQWLYRPGIQYELYRLLQAAMPEAGLEEAGLIVQQALEGPGDAAMDPERCARSRFDMVSWLAQSAPNAPGIAEAYGAVKGEHPDWAPDAPASINAGRTQNPFQRLRPFTVEQLHSWIRASASGAVARLEELLDSERGWGGPEFEEALRVLEQCTADYPDDGVSLLPPLTKGADALGCAGRDQRVGRSLSGRRSGRPCPGRARRIGPKPLRACDCRASGLWRPRREPDRMASLRWCPLTRCGGLGGPRPTRTAPRAGPFRGGAQQPCRPIDRILDPRRFPTWRSPGKNWTSWHWTSPTTSSTPTNRSSNRSASPKPKTS